MAKQQIFATADCETNPFKHGRVPVPFIWGFYDGNTYTRFFTTNAFIEHIKNFDGVVYAHNGGKFDWHFLLAALEANQNIMIINGRISRLKIGKCELRDSYNILPVPLSAYIKDDFDYTKLEKENRKKYMYDIEKYLENDCKYLYEIVERFRKDYGNKITLAGSCYKFWQDMTGEDPKSTKKYFEFFRPYYYGGRVECFKKGIIKNEFKMYDINSAYPYAMLHNHPYGTDYVISSTVPNSENEIQRCFIEISCISKGAFPFREESGLTFPRDNIKRTYTITGWEYLSGLKNKALSEIKILRVIEFEKKINFKKYVVHFYKMKNKCKGKDKAGYLLAKLFLNSLYGRMAINGEKFKKYYTVYPWETEEKMMEGEELYGELGSFALMGHTVPENQQTFHNIAVGASITGFVRAYMFDHLCRAKNPLYCDTDSIACESLACEENDQIGGWECEGAFSDGAIGGKKMYAFKYINEKNKYKISCKGVKITEKEIYSLAKGETICYKNSAPTFSIKKEPTFVERNVKMT